VPTSDWGLQNLSLSELKVACNNFHPDGVLGRGGFGEVHRGTLNGQEIAVKRILEEKWRQIGQEASHKLLFTFITELQVMHNHPAENILPIMAVSFSETLETDPCLVYQYMPNGSVSDRLKCKTGTQPLTWKQRSNIAVGTARGLVHLHALKPPIIHGDIKSGNVLLDRHFEPKIGDFGLARGGAPEGTHLLVTTVKGTQAYLPIDYIRSRELCPAVDTFCYGIFMFELVCGRSPSHRPPGQGNDSMRDIFLDIDGSAAWKSEIDRWVDNKIPWDMWAYVLSCTGWDCAKDKRKRRPHMHGVWEALEKIVKNRQQLEHLQLGGSAEQPEATGATRTDNNAGGLPSFFDRCESGNRPKSTRTQNCNDPSSGIPSLPTGLLECGTDGTQLSKTDTRTSTDATDAHDFTSDPSFSIAICRDDDCSGMVDTTDFPPRLAEFFNDSRRSSLAQQQQQQQQQSIPDLSCLRLEAAASSSKV